MTAVRAWWVARQATRRELDAYLSAADGVLGGGLDGLEWDTDVEDSWAYGLDLLDEL